MMKHSEEFKQETVRISLTSGLSRERVGKDLGIGKSTLGKWISQYRPADLLAAPQADLARENERLRLENRVLDHVTPRSGSGFRINEVNPVFPTIHSEMKSPPRWYAGDFSFQPCCSVRSVGRTLRRRIAAGSGSSATNPSRLRSSRRCSLSGCRGDRRRSG